MNTPLDFKSELRACGAKILDLASELEDDDCDGGERRKATFIGKQIMLLHKRSYSKDDMLDAINIYLRSRNSYRALRDMLTLPCPNTIRDYFGKYGLTGGANECRAAVTNVFRALNDGQKDCFLSFDEIHIKAAFSYQGKYVMGNAFNTSKPTPANCILAVMVNPSYGAPAFVARLVPVKNMTADFLFDIITSVLEVVHNAGGRVFSLMSDDLSVNQKTFKMFHEKFDSKGISSISHPFKNSKFDRLFTLFDPTHLFKNIRNNWVTEKNQSLDFKDPESGKTFTAKWSDLKKLYKEETEGMLRETKLDYTTLHPNNFEKQKVQLVVNVFNEKTVAKLKTKKGMEGTYKFVQLVTRMWHILNTRSPESAKRLNDPDREKFSDAEDPRLEFILKMSTMFKEMDNSLRGQRVRGLTGETANALHQTLVGMVDLIRLLLEKGYAYVLPGKFSSDRIEAEFGLCRASGGGNYLIGAEQVINSVKLQRLKLYAKLEIEVEVEDDWANDDCCTSDLVDCEADLDLIDGCFADTENLTEIEKSALYYICGYITFKEKIVCEDEDEIVELPEEAEFTLNVSRGKLKLPPINLYDFSQYCYSFFKARKQKCCTKIFLEALLMIYEFTLYTFENVESIVRRLCNCFFKAFVKQETDSLKRKNKGAQQDKRETKRRRISGKD